MMPGDENSSEYDATHGGFDRSDTAPKVVVGGDWIGGPGAPAAVPKAAEDAIDQERSNARWGFILGAVVVLAGLYLILVGFGGSVDLLVEFADLKIHVVTGVVGIIVLLIGVAIILLTKQEIIFGPKTGNPADKAK